ncbi:hypothetical protein GCM10020256_53000 [Streptomyces thermocoprophilus]
MLPSECAEVLIVHASEDAPLEPDLTVGHGHHSREAVEQRGLPRTALSGDRCDLSAPQQHFRMSDGLCLTVEKLDTFSRQHF